MSDRLPPKPGERINRAKTIEFSLVFSIEHFFEHLLESFIINLGNSVFGREPKILLRINGILEAASGKRVD